MNDNRKNAKGSDEKAEKEREEEQKRKRRSGGEMR